ncbi:putative membrane protein [Dichanthelium oligosanthes]|uniref:Putative membrane protein n=1 Tax=Dichanthelium oligosanthes TaxID=888268 RepID=A0A1E5WHS4_9POAL|nr:putative membrane protein [Dichanthelium oligosanthes]
MQVPVGFLGKLWSFMSFLPFFILLLLLGSVKAILIGPVVAAIVFCGNSAVIIGLWPAHFIWTYYCVLKTERIRLALKILIGILLPLPLLLLPLLAMVGSLLGGIGYGVFVPLMATFEAVGEGVMDKLAHCFMDGTASTIAGACTVVHDVTDSCFHSYFSFMDDLIEKMGGDETPLDINRCTDDKCRGFVEEPMHVVERMAKVISFLFGFHAGLIAYQDDYVQEASFQMGLAYMISAVAIFDEYTNDLLYLREGSCLPRPKYRKADILKCETGQNKERYNDMAEPAERQHGHHKHRRVLHQSKTFMQTIQRLRPIQIWDWFFRSCELNGRILLSEGLITAGDMEEYLTKGKCKKLSIKLPAWCILQCLIPSAKSDSHGLLILTNFNWPKDKVFDWMLGPLLVIKEQIKKLDINEDEEMCLRKLIMMNKNEKPSDWDDSGFSSDDNIKRGQLQAIIRRLQGIVTNMSRVPSFRRRFINLVKALYLEAIEEGAIDGSRDVKRRVEADVASGMIGEKGTTDVAGSPNDTLGNIDMV